MISVFNLFRCEKIISEYLSNIVYAHRFLEIETGAICMRLDFVVKDNDIVKEVQR